MARTLRDRLSKQQQNEIVQRYLDGETSTQLAKVVKCTPGAILSLVTRSGHLTRTVSEAKRLQVSQKSDHEENPTPEEIAQICAELKAIEYKRMREEVEGPQQPQPGSPRRYRTLDGLVFLPQN